MVYDLARAVLLAVNADSKKFAYSIFNGRRYKGEFSKTDDY